MSREPQASKDGTLARPQSVPQSVPTPARGNQKKRRDAGASAIGSHAGAWEPENKILARGTESGRASVLSLRNKCRNVQNL